MIENGARDAITGGADAAPGVGWRQPARACSPTPVFLAAAGSAQVSDCRRPLALPRSPGPGEPDLLRARRALARAANRLDRIRTRPAVLDRRGRLLDAGLLRPRHDPVPVGRRCRLPGRPAVLLRRHRAPDQAANRPFHPRQLAGRGDRWAGRCVDRHRGASARPGRSDGGRSGSGADEPGLSARRHPVDRLHRRRARGQRGPRGRGVPGDRRRADRLDARRRDLPLPGGDLQLCRGLARRAMATRRAC